MNQSTDSISRGVSASSPDPGSSPDSTSFSTAPQLLLAGDLPFPSPPCRRPIHLSSSPLRLPAVPVLVPSKHRRPVEAPLEKGGIFRGRICWGKLDPLAAMPDPVVAMPDPVAALRMVEGADPVAASPLRLVAIAGSHVAADFAGEASCCSPVEARRLLCLAGTPSSSSCGGLKLRSGITMAE